MSKSKKNDKNRSSVDSRKEKELKNSSIQEKDAKNKGESESESVKNNLNSKPDEVNEPAKFKKHPNFGRKQSRSGKMKSPEHTSKQNPYINILDQHKAHQLRIFKIIALVTIVVISLILIGKYYADVKYQKRQAKMVADIQKRVSLYRNKAEMGSTHERNLALSKAIATTYVGELKDWRHKSVWIAERKKLFEAIKPVMPKPQKDFVLPSLALDMAFIPMGTFRMGRAPNEVAGAAFDEIPEHSVRMEYHFWMAKTETTNFQYKIFYPGYGTRRWNGYSFNLPSQPAVLISWHLANEFCEMLNFKEKKAKRLPVGYVYRLPTEAEWEYACRAGMKTQFYWGATFDPNGVKFANVLDKKSARFLDCSTSKDAPKRDGHFVTAPVGSFKPNAFGLYDMSGNVWEWCYDWYNPQAYDDLPELNPVQTTPVVAELAIRGKFERKRVIESTAKVIRGGGCLSPPEDCRSAKRDRLLPEKRDMGVGFRVVLAPPIDTLVPPLEKK